MATEADSPSQQWAACVAEESEAKMKIRTTMSDVLQLESRETGLRRDASKLLLDCPRLSEEESGRVETSLIQLDKVAFNPLRWPFKKLQYLFVEGFRRYRHALADSSTALSGLLTAFEHHLAARRPTLVNQASVLLDHEDDPSWKVAEGPRYYLNRLRTTWSTIAQLDKYIVELQHQHSVLAECQATRQRLMRAAGEDGIELDASSTARLEWERLRLMLRG